ncbi:MAG: hypothetical protein LBB45_07135 [Methanobrevibacter sp.]|nr:hypothetical protein [Candidatus Methanovirga basalitermitum]
MNTEEGKLKYSRRMRMVEHTHGHDKHNLNGRMVDHRIRENKDRKRIKCYKL